MSQPDLDISIDDHGTFCVAKVRGTKHESRSDEVIQPPHHQILYRSYAVTRPVGTLFSVTCDKVESSFRKER
jgi:hypothetical protein